MESSSSFLPTNRHGKISYDDYLNWIFSKNKKNGSNVKEIEIVEEDLMEYYMEYEDKFKKFIKRSILLEEDDELIYKENFKLVINNIPKLINLEKVKIVANDTYDIDSYQIIPKSFDQLKKLKSIIINYCKIQDVESLLLNNPNLEYLDLRDCNLSRIPEAVRTLTSLQYLILSDNRITGDIPSWISELPLIGIYLESNQITGVPESIGNIATLRALHLSYNEINNLPDSIQNIRPNLTLGFQIIHNPITRRNRNELTPIVRAIVFPPPRRRNIRNNNFEVENNAPALMQFEAPAGIAFEIHNAFSKIDIGKLLNFFKTKVTIPIPIRNAASFKTYIKNTLTNFINQNITNSNSKNKLLVDLDRLYNSHIKYFTLSNEKVNLITYILEYVKAQPKEFQSTYIENFIKGCVYAYNGASGMSCAKGVIERFVTELVTASVLASTNSKLAKPEYIELIQIIENKKINLKDYKQLFIQFTNECFKQIKQEIQEASSAVNFSEAILEEKFKNCMLEKIGSNNANVKPELNRYSNELKNQGMFNKNIILIAPNVGGRRKTRKRSHLKKRKATRKYKR